MYVILMGWFIVLIPLKVRQRVNGNIRMGKESLKDVIQSKVISDSGEKGKNSGFSSDPNYAVVKSPSVYIF